MPIIEDDFSSCYGGDVYCDSVAPIECQTFKLHIKSRGNSMFFSKVTPFCFLMLLYLCGCSSQSEIINKTEILPHGLEYISELVTPAPNSSLSFLEEISEDFRFKRERYKTWKKDKASLLFSLKGCDYNLQETLELVLEASKEALKEIEYPTFNANFFHPISTQLHGNTKTPKNIFWLASCRP